jgi:uncharacterized repeat protein (TIGR02543 family)
VLDSDNYMELDVKASYTITFNANGGSGAPGTGETKSNDYVIPNTVPTRPGYIFMGWGKRKADKTAVYQPGDAMKIYSDKAFYAVWAEPAVADDYRMKAEAQALKRRTEYSEDTWDKASAERKKAILNNFLADVQAILGTTANSEIEFKVIESRGAYYASKNKIMIHIDELESPDSYVLLNTVIHECRHAYQYETVKGKNNHDVSEETRKQWADNFENYIEGPAKEYQDQPIEWDAVSFAGQEARLRGRVADYSGSWPNSY